MLLKAHIATALSLAVAVDYYIARVNPVYAHSYLVRSLILVTVWLLQVLVDAVGHTWKFYRGVSYPARNRWHSLPAMLGLAVAVGAPLGYLMGEWRVACIYLSTLLLHWVEDLVTESGVYLLGRRVRLPWRISYNNVLANRIDILVVLGFMLYYVNVFSSPYTFVVSMTDVMVSVYAFITV